MIRHSFQIVPGIGQARETELWSCGITHWSQLPLPLVSVRPEWLSGAHEARLAEAARSCEAALAAGDVESLVKVFPARERWRLYRELLSRAAFFDIETDGTREAEPTVASVFSPEGVRLFIAGRNMDEVSAELGRWPVWITFGGVRCDEPWLRRRYPGLPRPAFHFDLCPFARNGLGLKGGLKKLEEALGFPRPDHLKGVTGRDAVFLWEDWRVRGDRRALRFLCEYNVYDSVQLRSVADALFQKAAEGLEARAGRPFACRTPLPPPFRIQEAMGLVNGALEGV